MMITSEFTVYFDISLARYGVFIKSDKIEINHLIVTTNYTEQDHSMNESLFPVFLIPVEMVSTIYDTILAFQIMKIWLNTCLIFYNIFLYLLWLAKVYFFIRASFLFEGILIINTYKWYLKIENKYQIDILKSATQNTLWNIYRNMY